MDKRKTTVMAGMRDLARQIETSKLADSKALELKGPNVRGPSLIPGQLYLGKSWKNTVEGSDNCWFALRFVGAGHQTGRSERKLYDENPRLIDMKEGDFYFFEHMKDGKIGEFNAYQSDHCLVYGETPVRLTFFEIKDVTVQVKPEKAVEKGKSTKKVDDKSKRGSTRVSSRKKPAETEAKDSNKEEELPTEAEASNTDISDNSGPNDEVVENPAEQEVEAAETEHESADEADGDPSKDKQESVATVHH